METSGEPPTPPLDLSESLASELRDASVHDLREAIIYAQELLQFRHEPGERIEVLPGDELVRLQEHSGYTEVVVRQACGTGCPQCPHGPYLYHVTRESTPDGEDRVHWDFIGRTTVDDEDRTD